ncbi:MAG: DUF3108 domain-containing protein [Paraprevotella sp.]|nr:DUF3108 domain-containing protein [Paraprevotella sp.]
MKKKIILGLLLILSGAASIPIQAQCTAENDAFSAGEDFSYKLYFNWKFIWVTVGSANMSIKGTKYNGENAYRCHLITRGNKAADRLFVLRDTLISVVNEDMVPYYYRKGALEGDRYTVDEAWYSYDNGKNQTKMRFRTHKGEIRQNNQQSSVCVYDMLSMMLRARSFDASNYKVGQKIHFPMVDGGKVEGQTLIYRGKKVFKTEKSKTKYRCLVFSFVEYDNGKEKEVVTFYITDDKNHLPVRLDMYLRFGSAKAFLTEAKGVRNPQTSIIK